MALPLDLIEMVIKDLAIPEQKEPTSVTKRFSRMDLLKEMYVQVCHVQQKLDPFERLYRLLELEKEEIKDRISMLKLIQSK